MTGINPSKTTYALIKKAVEKGIRDIREDPERGARNLVDLGERFANGRFQKEFFSKAQLALLPPDNAYHKIMHNLIRNTDADILTTIGMNIGYNSWTFGAQHIREIEERDHFNIPWALLFNFTEDNRGMPDFSIMQTCVEQGKDLGIFSYMFFLTEQCMMQLQQLIDFAEGERNCAFVFFLRAPLINDTIAEKILEAKNIVPVLDLDGEDNALCSASKTLLGRGCLFGGYSDCGDVERDAQAALEKAAALYMPLLVLLNGKTMMQDPSAQAGRKVALANIRDTLEAPVFAVDFFNDILHVDAVISTDPCIATVCKDGMVQVVNADMACSRSTKHLPDTPLREILQQLLSKIPGAPTDG